MTSYWTTFVFVLLAVFFRFYQVGPADSIGGIPVMVRAVCAMDMFVSDLVLVWCVSRLRRGYAFCASVFLYG